MRLVQAHGAGPAAVDDGAQEHLFLPVFTMMLQRFGGAVREQRVVAPGQVGGVDHLLERYPERFGQALPAEGFIGGQAVPATVDELLVRLLEAFGCGPRAAGLVVAAAPGVAGPLGRASVREKG